MNLLTHKVGQKRQDTKEFIEYDSIYIKVKSKRKQLMVLEVRMMFTEVSVVGVGLVTGMRQNRCHWCCFLIWVIITKCVYFVKIHQTIHLLFVQFSVGIIGQLTLF